MTGQELKKLSATSLISQGGSRKVILLEDVVIKFPMYLNSSKYIDRKQSNKTIFLKAKSNFYGYGSSGIEQTLAEWNIWEKCLEEYRYLLCPIIEKGFTDDNIPYTIMKRAKTFYQWGEGDNSINFFYYVLKTKLHLSEDEISKIVNDIIHLGIDCSFESDDILKNSSNIGALNCKFTAIDYGFRHSHWID